ncbi:MAG: hypothetical protein HY804_06015 [Nitrospinae bacterium]|nr:hypothetical protein [Nitrospinota bacterium]
MAQVLKGEARERFNESLPFIFFIFGAAAVSGLLIAFLALGMILTP